MKCESAACPEEGLVYIVEVRRRALTSEHWNCQGHAASLWEAYLADTRIGLGSASAVPGAVAFELELIVAGGGQEIERILLREAEGSRRLVLPIAGLERCFLYYGVEDSDFKWLGPHATMAIFIEALGATLLYVMIDKRVPEGYFTAKATLKRHDEVVELPIRTSDGLCLALISGVPYLVAEDPLTNEITDVYSPLVGRK